MEQNPVQVISRTEDLSLILAAWPGEGILGLDVETSPLEVAMKSVTQTRPLTPEEEPEPNPEWDALADDNTPKVFVKEEVTVFDDDENKRRALDAYRNRLRMLQLSDGVTTFVVLCDELEEEGSQRWRCLKVLQPLLDRNLLVGSNITFDCMQLQHHAGLRLQNLWDLSIVERALTAGKYATNGEWYKAASLSGVAQKYLEVELSKEVRNSFGCGLPITQEQIDYGAGDVLHLVMLYVLQKSVVDREGAADAVDIEMGAIQAVVDMQLQGMYVSREKWTEIADTALINKRQKYDELQYLLLPDSYKQLMGESARLCKVFDPNSSPDTIKAYKRIGVHLGAKDRQGKVVAESAEERYVKAAIVSATNEQQKEALRTLQLYKEYAKQYSTYGPEWLRHIHPVTGRVHQSLDQYGAETGRYTSSKPNLQNIPVRDHPEYREAFAVPADSELAIVGADFAGCEMRCLAYLSQDPALMSAYNNDPERDIHVFAAALIYSKDYDEISQKVAEGEKSAKKLRRTAKNLNFGIAYGIGYNKLSEDSGITVAEAKVALEGWRNAFPKASAFLTEQSRLAWEQGVLYGIIGHRLYFLRPDPNLPREDYNKQKAALERTARNFPEQGANSVMTKYATHLLVPRLRPYGAVLCHVVHDEIASICHEAVAEDVAVILKTTMIEAGNFFLKETDERRAVRMIC